MNTLPPQFEPDRLLKVHEIASEMLADEKTVYRRIRDRKLAAFKEGGRWLMWRSKLLIHLNRDGGTHV